MAMKITKTRDEWYNDYMDYRLSFKYKKPANDFVRCFLNWCDRTYPKTKFLNQVMIDTWCTKRDTEKNISHASRTLAVNAFLRYMNGRGEGPFEYTLHGEIEKSPEPVLFDYEEVKNFFRAVDELEYKENCYLPYPRFQSKLKCMIAPAIFRLIYSTGMRPNEARWLDCKDVDLERKVIYIRKSKGYHERIIALHESTAMMLRQYNELMSKEMPGRKVFFPNDKDHYRDSYYIRTIFNRCWYKYNKKTSDRNVVVYSFRHNYAVQNILSWKHTGYDFDMNLLALCKSMGHQRPESTLYYFHLVPQLADMLEDIEGDSICEILPDIL